MGWLSRLSGGGGNQIRPVVLVVLDGFGLAPPSEGNAIYLAKTPYYEHFLKTYPHGQLIASGESVGLPANEVGNSEVGHLTLGVGRVIYQSLERINNSIRDRSFYENSVFHEAISHARNHNSTFHLLGLIGSGNVHSSTNHLYALLKFCQKNAFVNVALHLFTDGRDSPPQEAVAVVREIQDYLEETGIGRIATVIGRYYAMDRDARWDRTKLAYEAMVLGKGLQFTSAEEAIKATYAQGKSDEFVPPSIILSNQQQVTTINDNDAALFFNFRVDRPRQLSMALTMPDFERLKPMDFGFDLYRDESKPSSSQKQTVSGTTFARQKVLQNLYFATMTEYQKEIPVSAIAFPMEEQIQNSLTEVLSRHGYRQFHLAESEKERMVTYYFDGKRTSFPGEDVEIVPSPKVATYDLKPGMAVGAIMKAFKKALSKNIYHFLLVNFANPDMVAHTGNIKATVKAIEAVDVAIGDISREVLVRNGLLVITADHGNAEELISYPAGAYFYTSQEGKVNTDHSNFPVPLLVIGNEFVGRAVELPKGNQTDVAPTILHYMRLPVPNEMMGKDLLSAVATTNSQHQEVGGSQADQTSPQTDAVGQPVESVVKKS